MLLVVTLWFMLTEYCGLSTCLFVSNFLQTALYIFPLGGRRRHNQSVVLVNRSNLLCWFSPRVGHFKTLLEDIQEQDYIVCTVCYLMNTGRLYPGVIRVVGNYEPSTTTTSTTTTNTARTIVAIYRGMLVCGYGKYGPMEPLVSMLPGCQCPLRASESPAASHSPVHTVGSWVNGAW